MKCHEAVTLTVYHRLVQPNVVASRQEQVMENMNQLYAYLKGRSDGAITRAKVEPMP